MSIESFLTQDKRPLDADGFELACWDNPFLAVPDEDEQDPAEWPSTEEIDGWRWVPTEPGYEPSPEDVAWLNEQPTTDDLAEFEAWLDHLDEGYPREYPDAGYLTDRDVMTATGGCG